MEFVTITPFKFMQDAFQTSNKTLVLAHLVEEGNELQRACLEFKKKGGEVWMDNSFYELRENKDVEWLTDKAKLIDADVLVFPDIPMRSNLRFIIENGIHKIRKLGYLKKILVTVYADNKDFKEDLEQFKILNTIPGISILAITYAFRKEDGMRRPDFLKMIDKEIKKGKLKINKHIHLFGVNSWENFKKEIEYDWIKSADSTMPFKLGVNKIKLPIKDEQDIKRSTNYFNIVELSEEQRDAINYNLKYVKQICENEKTND